MPSVDDRIVAMEFQNKNFEEKIAQTIGSIDLLKKNLDFANATKNLGDLQKAGSSFSLAGLSSAVEGMAGKFTAMGAVAFSVIKNITDRAISAGISITKSLSLDLVLGGFHEYETNIGAIQTILSNTKADGTSLDQVNAALQQLNTYSDQTIYNFSQMAKNIGTFTAAGVDLDTSVNAIKGIANLAALSGSNADQAATAMYQLSQALASGSVKLMDWNSVVNAGMGGEIFQKALFNTAKQLGTIKDVPMAQTFEQWKAAGNTFRDSLQDGWITGQVLTDTLSQFTGDLTDAQLQAMGYTADQIAQIQELGQTGKDAATKVKTLTQLISTVKESIGSGWTKSFQLVFGDFNQAIDLFTSVNNAIGGFVSKQADARNAILQGWQDMGGRFLLIVGLKQLFEDLAAVMKPIREAFRGIFPPMTAEKLVAITRSFFELTQKLKISGDTADTIRTIFSGVFSALDIGWTIIKEGVRAIGELFSAFASQNGSGILDFFSNLAVKIAFFHGALVEGGGIRAFFDTLVAAIKNPGQAIDDLKARFQTFWDTVKKVADSADFGSLDGVSTFFQNLAGYLRAFRFEGLSKISDFFGNLFGGFDLQTSNSMEGGLSRLGDRLTTLGDVLKKVWTVFSWFGEKFGQFWDKMGQLKDWAMKKVHEIIDVISGIGPALLDAAKKLDFDKVMELIQTGIAAVFAGGFANISKNGLGIDFTGGSLASISKFFDGLQGTGAALNKSLGEVTNTLQAMQTKLKADALQKIAIAMGILAVSMILLSTVDPKALGVALAAMGVGFAQLATTMGVLTKVVSGPSDAAKLGILGGALILLAGAVLVMAAAVKIFSTMDNAELAKGLGSVILMIGTLVAAAKLLQGSTAGMITAGIGMTAMAVALNIIAVAVKIFATMSWQELSKGFAAVAVGLGLIAAATQLMPSGPQMLLMGAGILAISVALNLMATAMKIIATMSWQDIAKGLVGVAGGLLAIALALNFMPKGPMMVAAGVGLLAISVSLNLMAVALKLLATMSWGEIAKSMVAMAAALLILVVAARAMEDGVLGAIAIGLMAVSLGLLVKVLKQFATMSWGELLKGLVGLAAVLLVLGGAAYVLSPVVVSMLALGVAMLALGAGFALFGLGAGLFATAFVTIAAAGKAGVDLLLYAFDQLLARMPEIVTQFGGAILLLVQIVLDAIPAMVLAVGDIIVAFLQVIIDAAPKLGEALVTVIQTGLKAVRDVIPDIVATGFAILIALLTGVRDNIGEITTLVADIITNFLDALALKVPEIIDSVTNLALAIIKGVAEKLGDLALFLVPKGLELLQGLWNGIKTKSGELFTWVGGLPNAILQMIGDVLKTLYDKGKDILQGLWDGITFVWDLAIAFIKSIPGLIIDAFPNPLTLLWQVGSDIMMGLKNGLFSVKDKILGVAGDIAGGIKDTISAPFSFLGGPSRTMCSYGIFIGQGLADGMTSQQSYVLAASAGLATAVVDGFNPNTKTLTTRTVDAVNQALLLTANQISTTTDFNPTITPVLDLSVVQRDSLKLARMLGPNPDFAATAFAQASYIIRDTAAQADESTPSYSTRETPPSTIQFVQNNTSPEALSTAAIYRATRNQIEMAKEELGVG